MRLALALVAMFALGCETSHIGIDANDVDGGGCGRASDCTGTSVCVGGSCVAPSACASSRECPGLVCDLARGVCADCAADRDCTGDQSCVAGVCGILAGCATDCAAMHMVCDATSHACVACVTSGDCASDSFCGPSRTCLADECPQGQPVCVGNGVSICHADGSGLGAPVPCAGDCVDGRCVPEAGAPDAGEDAAIVVDANVACFGGDLAGERVPAGTTLIASAGDPAPSIDGDVSTGWQPGGSSAFVRLTFPTPTYVSSIHLAAGAQPESDETYIIRDLLGGHTVGTATRHVVVVPTDSSPRPALAPIEITPGSYTTLDITIDGGMSWVDIAEITLGTTACP